MNKWDRGVYCFVSDGAASRFHGAFLSEESESNCQATGFGVKSNLLLKGKGNDFRMLNMEFQESFGILAMENLNKMA